MELKKLLALSVVAFSTSLAVHAEHMTRQEYNDFRGWNLPENENGSDSGYLFEDRAGQKNTEKYQGFVQWLPENEFQRKYKQNSHLSFGSALEALKQGHKICRSGWNGKDQYVVAQAQTTTTEASKIWNPHNKAHAEKIGGQIDVAPYCTLKTAQDTLAMGWTPSTGDLFANDWLILE